MYIIANKKIKVNGSKIDNYIERIQQPLISDQLEKEFKNTISEQAVRYTKN